MCVCVCVCVCVHVCVCEHVRMSTRAHTNTHATNTCITSDGLLKPDQYAEEKTHVFSFELKEESEDECLTERGCEIQSTGPVH